MNILKCYENLSKIYYLPKKGNRAFNKKACGYILHGYNLFELLWSDNIVKYKGKKSFYFTTAELY